MANGKLYVADTNNHAIRVVDLKGKTTSTLQIKELQPPPSAVATDSPETEAGPNTQEIQLETQTVRAGNDGSLIVRLTFRLVTI